MADHPKIGYHISHEQFPPGVLLEYARFAENAGFYAALSSDHFCPWNREQGQSGFAWSWLGSAMEATSLNFGVVNAPGQRYHPAIIAQAAATLCEMYPGRFWLGQGSGQAMNETITGGRWPGKMLRNARLKECVDIIRALWSGETVTWNGLVKVEEARLYTLPSVPPPIIGAAITAETARWMGGWADGLITISQPLEDLKRVIDAFRQGGGAGKPLTLKVQLSYDSSDEKARAGAFSQWRSNIFNSAMLSELRFPWQFEQAARFVRPEDLDRCVHVSAEPGVHAEWIERYARLGFDLIILHNVNLEQDQFIEVFGDKVLPIFKS